MVEDRYIKSLAKKENIEVPASFCLAVSRTLEKLPEVSPRGRNNRKGWKRALISVAAVFTFFISLLNVFPSIAVAAKDVPLLGAFVQVFTFRTYQYDQDRYHADVTIPQLTVSGSEDLSQAAEEINEDVESLVDPLIEQFKSEVVSNIGSYSDIIVNYDIITDTEDWFTLKVMLYRGAGSGSESYKYYHIDKTTGKQAYLKDLFPENSDYISVISEEILRQMREQMQEDEWAVYWIDGKLGDEDFTRISEDQNFYLTEDGGIVIIFDKYEVAPGAMGCPEFKISAQLVEQLQEE